MKCCCRSCASSLGKTSSSFKLAPSEVRSINGFLSSFSYNKSSSQQHVRNSSIQTGDTAVTGRAHTTLRPFNGLLMPSQHARRWASESTQGGSSNALMYGGVGAGALGLGAWYLNSGGAKAESKAPASKEEEKNVPAQAAEASKVFRGGDQGFIPLTLDKVEELSKHTKRFRFKFDGEDSVSGLTIASALITKYKGPEDEKPTIRPYTPVSDEGEHINSPTMFSRTNTRQTHPATSTS